MKKKSKLSYSVLMFLGILVAGLIVVNIVAGRYIKNEAGKYSRYEVKAVSDDGDIDYLICNELCGNPYFDFFLHQITNQYADIENIGMEVIDTDNPVQCVRHNFDATKVMTDLPFPQPKKEGVRRVVFIGDSFTYGEAAPDGTAFPEAINSYLRLNGNPGAWESVNFGVIGADIPFLYDMNFKKALKADPDVIVYVWLANDIPSPVGDSDIRKLNFLINERNMIVRSKGMPVVKLLKASSMNRRLTRESLKWYREKNGPSNEAGVAEFKSSVSSMKREAEEAGVEFHVALFPILTGTPENYPLADAHKFVQDILKESGIEYIDLTEDVLSAPEDQLWVSPANHHPNVFAHRLAAKALMKYLEMTPSSDGESQGSKTGASEKPSAYEENNPPRDDGEKRKIILVDDEISKSTIEDVIKEAMQMPEGTVFVTNSSSLISRDDNPMESKSVDIQIHLDEFKRPATEYCKDGLPCVYILVVPDRVRNTFYLPDFSLPGISKMTFFDSTVFFIFPEDISLAVAWQ